MGRLKRRSKLARLLGVVKLWALPVMIALSLVIGTNFVLADQAPTPSELSEYLKDKQLAVRSETIGDYQQVYYLYKNKKFFVTDGPVNHANPKASGRYIVWYESLDGPSQIVLYDILTKTSVHLSTYGANADADLESSRVVWQHWADEQWQIMFYDGSDVTQISTGASSLRPRIHGGNIMYVQHTPDDPDGKVWHVVKYDIETKRTEVILTTDDATKAWPHFDDTGKLLTDYDQNYLAS